jgi:hypothetical protein
MTPDEIQDLDGAFENAPEPEDMVEIPDGTYVATVSEIGLLRSQVGVRYLKWKFKIAVGEERGKQITKLNALKTDSMEWVKGDLRKAGVGIQKISELPRVIHDIPGSWVEIHLKTKPDKNGEQRQNCYINKPFERLTEDAPPEEDAPF